MAATAYKGREACLGVRAKPGGGGVEPGAAGTQARAHV
jgi:hypothetical protein